MKPAHSSIRRVIWGLDPMDSDSESQKKVYETLCTLSATDSPAEIIPTWVTVPDAAFGSSSWHLNNCRQAAIRKMNKTIASLSLRSTKSLSLPRVLLFQSELTAPATPKQLAQVLERYAWETDADLIAVGTHALHGVDRLVLGSFAESIRGMSRTPVLTLNPNCRHFEVNTRNVLFPTDFSERSLRTFREVLSMTRHIGATLTIFHTLPSTLLPLEADTRLGGAWMPVTPAQLEEAETRARESARPWLTLAREEGVKADLQLDRYAVSVSESVLQYVRRHPTELIALGGKDSMKSTVLRTVERSSPCPVWTTRPENAA